MGKYIIGDNAYVCSEHLLTPFSGDEKKDQQKDAYNFYLSQIRIQVEMMFGRFVNKWRIFKRPLQVHLKNVGKVFLCAICLYNFCVNEGMANLDAALNNGEIEGVVPSAKTTLIFDFILNDTSGPASILNFDLKI